MNIFGNLIKDTEIIGISDIIGTEVTPGNESTETIAYHFRVYTKSNSILITSPDYSKRQEANKDTWLKSYLTVREKIAEQIGEIFQKH